LPHRCRWAPDRPSLIGDAGEVLTHRIRWRRVPLKGILRFRFKHVGTVRVAGRVVEQVVLFHATGPGEFTCLTGGEMAFPVGHVPVGVRKSRFDEQMIHITCKTLGFF
jgi:hypothetical protein